MCSNTGKISGTRRTPGQSITASLGKQQYKLSDCVFKGANSILWPMRVTLNLVDIGSEIFSFILINRSQKDRMPELAILLFGEGWFFYKVESCCILFSAILRWFNSTIKSQEPLRNNRAITIHLGQILGGWFFSLINLLTILTLVNNLVYLRCPES